MIQLEEMLQSSGFLVWDGLDIVDSDGLDVDGTCPRCPAEAELGDGKRDKGGKHDVEVQRPA